MELLPFVSTFCAALPAPTGQPLTAVIRATSNISGLTSQSAAEDGYLFFDWCLGDRIWTLVFSLTVAHVGSLWPTFLGWHVQGLCCCAVRFSIPQIDSSSRNLANSPWRFKTMTIPGRKKWCIFSRHRSYKDVVDRFSAWRRHWMLKSHEIISFRSWWTPCLGPVAMSLQPSLIEICVAVPWPNLGPLPLSIAWERHRILFVRMIFSRIHWTPKLDGLMIITPGICRSMSSLFLRHTTMPPWYTKEP